MKGRGERERQKEREIANIEIFYSQVFYMKERKSESDKERTRKIESECVCVRE